MVTGDLKPIFRIGVTNPFISTQNHTIAGLEKCVISPIYISKQTLILCASKFAFYFKFLSNIIWTLFI
jgi:hypothetical protein